MLCKTLLTGSLMGASFFLNKDAEQPMTTIYQQHTFSAETMVVIGGNRGIGLGFVRYYLSQENSPRDIKQSLQHARRNEDAY